METYYLGALLEDKELCKEIISKGFTLCDKNDILGDIDFVNNSMRFNHISTFKKLYEIGGKELFDNILKSGKTCLCDSPDAAKVGVVEIEGADGFYLKSNVSAIVALMSILNAIKSLDTVNSEIDPSVDFYAKLGEDETEEDEFDFDSFGDITIDEDDEPEYYENNLIIEKTDEGYILCDAETGEQVTFECSDGNENKQISVMYNIEHLQYDEDTEISPYSGSELALKAPQGYRYQLEKDGKWGFISEHFAHFVYPVYFYININDDGEVVGYYYTSESEITISVAHPVNYTSLDNYSEYDKVLHGAEVKYGYIDKYKDFYLLRDVPESYAPIGDFAVTYVQDDYSTVGIAYAADTDLLNTQRKGIYKCKCKDDSAFSYNRQYDAQYKDGFIILENKGIFGGEKIKKAPAMSFNAKFCDIALKWEDTDGIQYVSMIGESLYIAKKEGYYGVVKYNPDNKTLDYETPFAFTNIQKLTDINWLVDRFGKKGVYNILLHSYVVPCQYEKIEHDVPYFTVYKGGFKGKVGIIGEWVEKLHRED